MNNLFEKLRAHFRQLAVNLKPMTFGEKVDHIWSYYKEYMFVAFILILILIAIIFAIGNIGLQYYNCGIMSNVELNMEGHTYLTDVFYEDVLGNPKGKTYLTVTNLSKEEYTVDDTNEIYQNYMSVLAKVEAKNLDYMLVDEYSFQYYVEDRIYMDLSQLLPPQELEELKSKNMLVYVREESEATGTPMGIEISSLPFGRDCLDTEGKVYLVFIRNSTEPENCLKLWEHIKEWPDYKEKIS